MKRKRISYCTGPDGCWYPADSKGQKTFTLRGFRYCGPCGKMIGRARRASRARRRLAKVAQDALDKIARTPPMEASREH